MTECTDDQKKPERAEANSAAPDSGYRVEQSLPGASDGQVRPGRLLILSVLLFSLVFVLFLPSINNGFINDCDDDVYVTANPQVQRGVTWENVRWAFGDVNVGFYHPLTLLSHALDCQLYGLNPWGHHLTNVLLHAFNTLLVFLVFRKMTGFTWRSFFLAALFGIHPLRVESVTWISERKDVLSTFFWLLTMWFYVRYVNGRAKSNPGQGAVGSLSQKSAFNYFLCLACFACGLLSKSTLVALPFALLLLDYWPLHRVSWSKFGLISTRDELANNAKPPSSNIPRLLLEKVPFLILAVAASAIAVVAQRKWGRLQLDLPLIVRADNALISCCRYLNKLFFPAKLAVFYPYRVWMAWQVFLAGALLLSISVYAVMSLRRRAYVAVGWFWFLGILAPVAGLVQVGVHSMADRYTYVPSIGFFLILVWSVCECTSIWSYRRTILGTLALALTVSCMALTHRQIGYWKDSETLFLHSARAVTDENVAKHYALGSNLATDGQFQEAITEFEKALQIDPYSAATHVGIGEALEKTPGRSEEAIPHYELAARINPGFPAAHYDLGVALAKKGRWPEAIGQYEMVLRIAPDSAAAHYNLGVGLERMERWPEAIAHFKEALRIKPTIAPACYHLGIVLEKTGRVAEAIIQFKQTLHLDPNWEPARASLERLQAIPGQP